MARRTSGARWGLPLMALAAVAAAPCLGEPGHAQTVADALPDWARSARIVGPTVVRVAPTAEAEIRGAVRQGTRVPVLESLASDNGACGTSGWLRVGQDAWVCRSRAVLAHEAPFGRTQPPVPAGTLLPFRYARVLEGGAHAFDGPDPDLAATVRTYPSGFIIATRLWGNDASSLHARTRGGHYVPQRSLQFLRPSRHMGVTLDDDGDLDGLGWITQYRAPLHARPSGGRVQTRLARLRRVRVVEELEGDVLRLERGGYVSAENVARPHLSAPPEGVAADEPWIDVHLPSQTLVAYRGARPVFATVVSSGRPYRDRETPTGEFRIWIKLAMATMDDIGNNDSGLDYSVESVPWVQYFEGSKAFHAAFWHDAFGARVSHGCVNLSPRDAQWLFDFTHPSLPDGWVSVRPTAGEPGTRVRIR